MLRALLSIVCFILLATSLSAATDSVNAERHYVFTATPVYDLRLVGTIGISLAMLPQPLTEYPTPAPMLDFRYKMNLMAGIGLYGRVASNIATTIAQAGAMYGIPIGSLSIAPGYSIAFVYGNVTFIDGFNTTQTRWINYPMISASWRFPKATLSARLEAEITTNVVSKIEDQPTSGDRNILTGGALTLTLEQPFFADRHILIGATFQLSSDPYQAWFLYNQFNDKLFSSEFFIGLIL